MKPDYARYSQKTIALYRELHQIPEIGFELDETAAVVKRELALCGIPFTEKYGKGSVVAEIGRGDKCIALRADMDALPIEEKSGLAYASRYPGRMHACGHDSHTAILLTAAKILKETESDLRFRVRFIFQPNEEGAVSGAEMMVQNGVLDGVEKIAALHCESMLPAHELGVREGNYQAACVPLTLTFLGKSAHAALPEQGIDAIAMANRAYTELCQAVREEAGEDPYIWSVGRFSGGHAHNIICDRCEMDISFRFYNMDFADRMEQRTKEICSRVAADFGGEVLVRWNMSTGPVINDAESVAEFRRAMERAGLPVRTLPGKMSSEDFGWYLTKVPGFLFRYGVRESENSCVYPPHTCDFRICESAMSTAVTAFCEYILFLNGDLS